jgi:DNA-binding MarR family transcriptional regulator
MPRLPDPESIPFDHIGVHLAEASRHWRQDFEARMSALGHLSVHEAATQALAFIPPEGATQATLGRAQGVSKQAAQQFVERLCQLDLVIRRPDPDDHRAVRIMLTDRGRQFVSDANQTKSAIETAYRAAMGNSAYAMFKATLGRLPSLGG